MEKLEWRDYLTANNTEDMFTRFDRIHESDGRTDTTRRHRKT